MRDALIKCLPCNAPGVKTLDGNFVCVECGTLVVTSMNKKQAVDIETAERMTGG